MKAPGSTPGSTLRFAHGVRERSCMVLLHGHATRMHRHQIPWRARKESERDAFWKILQNFGRDQTPARPPISRTSTVRACR